MFPVAQHLVGIRDGDVSEHVRVARDHLRGGRFGDLGGAEALLLGSDLSVHRHLQEDVSQLFLHLRVIARVDCFQQLVRLLEEVRPQRFMGLLAIPRTAPWSA